MTQKQHPLLPTEISRKHKDAITRIKTFLDWLEAKNLDWRKPDLDAYRDYLLHEKVSVSKPTTVAAYVSAVKRQYRRLLKERREQFSEAELEAINTATEIRTGQPKYKREPQVEHLTQGQIEQLLTAPDMNTQTGIRDTTIMALVLFAGLSETEICNLKIEDWREDGDSLYLRVGQHEVMVYERLFYYTPWVGRYLNRWMWNIESGFLFRGFYRGGNVVRKNKLNPNAIHEILRQYVEAIPDMPKFTVLDLRRTYARRLFDNDVPIDTIRENLGYSSKQTVINYIGLPDVKGQLGSYLRGNGQQMLDRLK